MLIEQTIRKKTEIKLVVKSFKAKTDLTPVNFYIINRNNFKLLERLQWLKLLSGQKKN